MRIASRKTLLASKTRFSVYQSHYLNFGLSTKTFKKRAVNFFYEQAVEKNEEN